MAFAIFDINILYNHVEKSRLLSFNKILYNKHATPPMFNFLKQWVSYGIFAQTDLIVLKTTYHKNFPRDQLLCNKTNILCFEYLFCCIIAGLLENSYDK